MSTKKTTKKFTSSPVQQSPSMTTVISSPPVASAKPATAAPATPVAQVASVAVAPVAVAPVVTPTPAAPSQLALALIRALRDTSADNASEAAISLGKLREPAALEPLIEVVTNSTGYYHSVVRAAACASLAQLGDRRATPALLTAIHDTMAEASAEAVRALAVLNDDRAIEPLTDVLRNERGFFLPVVRLAAVSALRQFKSPQAADALRTLAANSAEDMVLRNAAV